MIYNLIKGNHITLVDGGRQKRCFTDISDGIECLYRIIINQGNIFDKKIINIGNHQNEASINEFARILVEEFDKHPLRWKFPEFAGYKKLDGDTFYGKGYQDCEQRKPNIERAFRYCGWVPKITIKESIKRSVDYIINEALKYENI